MTDMRSKVRDGYDQGTYAETFRVGTTINAFEERFLSGFLELLPARPDIVDFGCGIGVPYGRYLVDRGARLTGLDISSKHLAMARQSVPEAEFIQADFSSWSPPRAFDGLISLYALFHIPRVEHAVAIRRIADALVSGGIFLFTVAGQEVPDSEAEWLGAPMIWSAFGPEVYLDIVAKCGFDIVDSAFEGESGADEHHFWILARKTAETIPAA